MGERAPFIKMFDFCKIQMPHKIHTGFLQISIISWQFRQGVYSPRGYKFSQRPGEIGLSDNCNRHAYLTFWNQYFLNFNKFEYENGNVIENIFRLLRLISFWYWLTFIGYEVFNINSFRLKTVFRNYGADFLQSFHCKYIFPGNVFFKSFGRYEAFLCQY